MTYLRLRLFPDSPEAQSHLVLHYAPVRCQTREGETVRCWMVVHTGEAWAGRSHQETGVRVPQITPQRAASDWCNQVPGGEEPEGAGWDLGNAGWLHPTGSSQWPLEASPASAPAAQQHVVHTEARTTCEMSLCVTAEFMGQLDH